MKKFLFFMAAMLISIMAVSAFADRFTGGTASQTTTAGYTNWTGVSGVEQFDFSGTMNILDTNYNVQSTGNGEIWDIAGWRYATIQWKGVYGGWYNYSTASGKTAGHAYRFGGYSDISPSHFKIYTAPTDSGPWSLYYVGATGMDFTHDGAITIPVCANKLAVSFTRSGNRAVDFYVTEGRDNQW